MDETKQILRSKDVYEQIICKVDTSRGAPMGRCGVGAKADATGKRIYRRHVPLVYDGAYDKGGAYWGIGSPLYVEYTLDKSYVAFFREQ